MRSARQTDIHLVIKDKVLHLIRCPHHSGTMSGMKKGCDMQSPVVVVSAVLAARTAATGRGGSRVGVVQMRSASRHHAAPNKKGIPAPGWHRFPNQTRLSRLLLDEPLSSGYCSMSVAGWP